MNDSTPTRHRPSPTLLICAIAGLVALVGLFLPSWSPVRTSGQTSAVALDGRDSNGIQIVDFGYGGQLSVQPGQTIQVINSDGVPHTITANDGSFDSGVIGGGAAGSFATPDVDGTYSFICTIHPSMTGELIVSL